MLGRLSVPGPPEMRLCTVLVFGRVDQEAQLVVIPVKNKYLCINTRQLWFSFYILSCLTSISIDVTRVYVSLRNLSVRVTTSSVTVATPGPSERRHVQSIRLHV